MDPETIAAIIAHMNTDHADAISLYAKHFAKIQNVKQARLITLNPTGIDIEADTDQGTIWARIPFASEVHTPGQARKALIEMARLARV